MTSARDVIANSGRPVNYAYDRACRTVQVAVDYDAADAILAALDAAGYAVVPKEPTAEMIAALRVSAPLGVQIAYKEILKAAKGKQ